MNDIEILKKFIEEYNASYPEKNEWVAIYPNQIQAIENLLKRNKELEYKYEKALDDLVKSEKERQEDKEKIKELEEYKRIAELTKISCCTAQNCEALNNAIKEGLENQKLKVELDKKDKIINLMAERLEHDTEWFFSEFDNYTKQDFIEYFTNEVEEDK